MELMAPHRVGGLDGDAGGADPDPVVSEPLLEAIGLFRTYRLPRPTPTLTGPAPDPNPMRS